jgi:hypothetical protein
MIVLLLPEAIPLNRKLILTKLVSYWPVSAQSRQDQPPKQVEFGMSTGLAGALNLYGRLVTHA